MNSKAGRWVLAILAHIALLVAWYLFVHLGNVPKFVMPSPVATLNALLQPNYSWWTNIAVHVHDRYQAVFPPDVAWVVDHARRATSTFPVARGRYYGVDYAARTEQDADLR